VALIVLLRGVNVGGKTFRPTELVRELSELDMLSTGAAGTFVVRAGTTPTQIRKRILEFLPFDAEIMLLTQKQLEALLELNPAGEVPPGDGVRRFLSVSTHPLRPRGVPPIFLPGRNDWQVALMGVAENCAFGYRRPLGERMLYPNEAMEKLFGLPFTTRWWETMELVQSKISPSGVKPAASRGRESARRSS
jgi:uncharacterized protein (DUF1697 family)